MAFCSDQEDVGYCMGHVGSLQPSTTQQKQEHHNQASGRGYQGTVQIGKSDIDRVNKTTFLMRNMISPENARHCKKGMAVTNLELPSTVQMTERGNSSTDA